MCFEFQTHLFEFRSDGMNSRITPLHESVIMMISLVVIHQTLPSLFPAEFPQVKQKLNFKFEIGIFQKIAS